MRNLQGNNKFFSQYSLVHAIIQLHRWMAGTINYRKLPLRVRQTIDRHQHEGEILIGVIQLIIVITFGILYFLSPKTFNEQAMFAPVPWALSIYLVFTLLRLYLAYRNRLPFWMLVISVIADMFLLLGLIWSFHLQYEQPASFYLKAPTLLYVFIFVSLRALRFEAGFVVLSGVMASIGWLALVVYAVNIDPGDSMITKDYVEYMTSNSVLLGAEFDKVISILTVTAILTIAIARAHRVLVQATTEGYAAAELARFVPTQVAHQIKSANDRVEAGEGNLGEATIFFIDLAGFTSIGESLPPEKLIETLNDYFRVAAAPIKQHHGVINQFQGDAILASFNLPEPQTDHAMNAVDAALEITDALAERTFYNQQSLSVRIGINTGQVVGGLVGTADRLNYTVHGDGVNLAARLEQLNKNFGTNILISESTFRLLPVDRYDYESIGTTMVRGRQTPVQLYTIRGLKKEKNKPI